MRRLAPTACVVLIGLFAAVALAAVGLAPLACREDPLEVVKSGGAAEAIIGLRDCGSRGSSSVYVDMYPAGNERSRVFEMDGGPDALPSWPHGFVPVQAEWLRDRTLMIRHDPRGRVVRHRPSYGDVSIQVEPFR